MSVSQNGNQNKTVTVDAIADKSDNLGFLWGLLSFFIPIVGIILAIVWWRDRHRNAKTCLICALIPTALFLLAMVGSLIFAAAASLNMV